MTKTVEVVSGKSDTKMGRDSMSAAPDTRRSTPTHEDVKCWVTVTIALCINVPRERLPEVREMITAFISVFSEPVQELVDEDPERTSFSWYEDIALGAGLGKVAPDVIRARSCHWPGGGGKRQVYRFRHAPTHRCLSIGQLEEVLYAELKYVRNRLSHCAEVRRREGALVVVEIDLSSIEIVEAEMEERLLEAEEIDVLIEGFGEAQNDSAPRV